MDPLHVTMNGTYDLNLVAISIAIAVFASYAALDLAGRVTEAQGRTRLWWLAGGAGAMGSGIWSMHYIGMLAFSLPIQVLYDVPTVLLSLLAAVFASAVALFVVSHPSMGFPQVLLGGSIMGLGITAMHYTGMAAMRLQATIRYDPLLVAASVAIAIGVSFVGLLLLFRFRERTTRWNWPKFASAVVMGLAIPSMHYTAMAAAGFLPADALADTARAVDVSVPGTLAIALGTVMLLGLALVVPRHRVPYAWLPVLIAVVTMLALVVGATALHYIETRLIAITGENLSLAAAEIADKLSRMLSERQKEAQTITRTLMAQKQDAAYLTRHLTWIKKSSGVYVWLGVTDQHGRIVAATNPATVGRDVSEEIWFQSVRQGGMIHVGDVQVDVVTDGTDAVAFTAPITSPEGKFVGAVTTRIAIAALEDAVTHTIRMLQAQHELLGTSEYQFMTYNGDVFVDSDLLHKGNVNLKQLKLPSALQSEMNMFGYIEEEHARRHVPVVTGYARSLGYQGFPGLQWTVLVRMDRNSILTPIRNVVWKLGAAAFVMGVPMVGLLFWATGRLRKEWATAELEKVHARAAENAAQKSERMTRQIVDTAQDAVLTMDAHGIITDWNIEAEPMFGLTRAEAIGQPMIPLIIAPVQREEYERGLQESLATGDGTILNKRAEITALRRDGSKFPAEMNLSIMPFEQTYQFSAFVRDITERKQLEESRLAVLTAEQASRAKSGFLSRVSHELRTPLNAILGFAQLLEMESLNAQQQKSVQHILKGGRHLLTLINEVLDISRIETGQLALSMEPVRVSDLASEVMGLIGPQAAASNIRVVTAPAEDPTLHVQADKQRLKQVLLNLLSNGVKYNREGGTLTVSWHSVPEGRVRITVTDTGVGIPPAMLTRLFTPFDRLGAEQAGTEGTGLGLALTKQLVTVLGGTISANSTVGQGTSFSVDLRQAHPQTMPGAAAPAVSEVEAGAPRETFTVLYVEDNLPNYELIKQLFEKWPTVRLLSAMQGAAGLELAAWHHPNLILLDLHLPDIPGHEVLSRLRANPATAVIPVVILSADATKGQIDRLRAAGAQAYLTKPIEVAAFYATVKEMMSMKGVNI